MQVSYTENFVIKRKKFQSIILNTEFFEYYYDFSQKYESSECWNSNWKFLNIKFIQRGISVQV
jgi:hypothetical protein